LHDSLSGRLYPQYTLSRELDEVGLVLNNRLHRVVCHSCKGVQPVENVHTHLVKWHKDTIKNVPSTRHFENVYNRLGVHGGYPDVPRDAPAQFAGLATRRGPVCPGCSKGFKDISSLQRHIARMGTRCVRPGDEVPINVPDVLQQQFTARAEARVWFQVSARTPLSSSDRERFVAQTLAEASEVPTLPAEERDPRDVDAWLNRLGWHCTVSGLNPRSIRRLIDLPSVDEEYANLRDYIMRLFREADDLLDCTHERLRAILNTPDPK
jgi:hypothetical protein